MAVTGTGIFSNLFPATVTGSAAPPSTWLTAVLNKRRVLAIGDIQSGKTRWYLNLVNELKQTGNKFHIILLTSNIKDVGKQTVDRVDKAVLDSDVSIYLKNTSQLTRARRLLETLRNNSPDIFVVVLDDEADQASPNTQEHSNLHKGMSEASKTHLAISEIVAMALGDMEQPIGCYLAVTATPLALLVMPRTGPLCPDVAILLPNHEEYYGLTEALDDSVILDEINDSEYVDEIRKVLCWYLTNCALAHFRQNGLGWPKLPQMLIHTHVRKNTHTTAAATLNKSAQELLDATKSTTCWQGLYTEWPVYAAHLHAAVRDLTKCSVTDHEVFKDKEAEFFKQIAVNIKAILAKDQIRVINSEYNEHTEKVFEETRCFVGGAKLSRGITIPGLVTTGFFRETNKTTPLDTIAQWSRFCGPRKVYKQYCRILLTANMQKSFKDAAEVNDKLKEALEALQDNETVNLDEWTRQFAASHKNMTRKGVQGMWLQDTTLLFGWNSYRYFTTNEAELVKQGEQFEKLVRNFGLAELQSTEEHYRLDPAKAHVLRETLKNLTLDADDSSLPSLSHLEGLIDWDLVCSGKQRVALYLPGPKYQQRATTWVSRQDSGISVGVIDNLFPGKGAPGTKVARELYQQDQISIHFRRIRPTADGVDLLSEGLYQVMAAVRRDISGGGPVSSIEIRGKSTT